MRITIYCPMADHPEYRMGQLETPGMVGPEWTGDIHGVRGESTMPLLERVFRLFNRVTDEDAERLHQLGYKLPSLSVGDIVTMKGANYLVMSVGFQKIDADTVQRIKDNPNDAWKIAYELRQA